MQNYNFEKHLINFFSSTCWLKPLDLHEIFCCFELNLSENMMNEANNADIQNREKICLISNGKN